MKNNLVSVVIVTKDRREDLIDCIESYLNSSYKQLEIIVVDNASKPPIVTWLPKKYPQLKIISSQSNIGAAAGRNLGLKEARGQYLLFSDDDAVCDKEMVTNLVDVFATQKDAGIVQPLVYDKRKKNYLQGAGHDINLTTGRIKAWGVKEKDIGQYQGLRQVPMCGCVWMVKKEVFKKIGEYDQDYFIPYEDSDFSIRARKTGFKLFCISKAKTWHRGPKVTFVHPWIEWLGITSSERAYRVARNKMIFMRKHSPFPNNLVFFFVVMPILSLLHTAIIILSGKFDILLNYWSGYISGIWYALTFPVRNLFFDFYKKFDERLYPAKMSLVAWTDPLPKIIDTSGKSILDLGCGQGKPMELIKSKMKVKKSIGVDLFEPYIEEARKRQIHDSYILADIRKISFPTKSFDIVIASHVLEHMKRYEAWKIVSRMEKIARKQVIMAAPIGEHYHPVADGNIYQIHKSAFLPEDFTKRGYKIEKYGWKWLLGYHGLVDRVGNDLLRKLLYVFNFLMTPIYRLYQPTCDYIFVAYKDLSKLD